MKRLGRQVDAVEARSKVLHSYYERLAGVAKSNPKLWRSRRLTMHRERT